MKPKFKIEIGILVCVIIFGLISILSIFSAQKLIIEKGLVFKQIIWYIIGLILILLVMHSGNKFLYKISPILYITGIILLILVLIFGNPINNAKCWFKIPGIGNIQPSEFMKIALILIVSKLINKFKLKYDKPTIIQEFIFLLKIILIVGIPSILTFLEPDTGVVLIYLLITLVMLFISGIRLRWFIILFGLIIGGIGIVLLIYLFYNDLFIKIFGTTFFLRIDRLLDWSNKSGFQLQQGITAIGSGGILGYGVGNTPIYFPEPQTDFIFAVFANNFGFIGVTVLIILMTFFDLKLINIAIESTKNIDKYIISGFLGMLIYQQLQNIGMTIGLMPITGITLPFISYGGSSLLSYMAMVGIVFNIYNNTKYVNKKRLYF